jgi:hypothetical protein
MLAAAHPSWPTPIRKPITVVMNVVEEWWSGVKISLFEHLEYVLYSSLGVEKFDCSGVYGSR